jgi:hypothetical protein
MVEPSAAPRDRRPNTWELRIISRGAPQDVAEIRSSSNCVGSIPIVRRSCPPRFDAKANPIASDQTGQQTKLSTRLGSVTLGSQESCPMRAPASSRSSYANAPWASGGTGHHWGSRSAGGPSVTWGYVDALAHRIYDMGHQSAT